MQPQYHYIPYTVHQEDTDQAVFDEEVDQTAIYGAAPDQPLILLTPQCGAGDTGRRAQAGGRTIADDGSAGPNPVRRTGKWRRCCAAVVLTGVAGIAVVCGVTGRNVFTGAPLFREERSVAAGGLLSRPETAVETAPAMAAWALRGNTAEQPRQAATAVGSEQARGLEEGVAAAPERIQEEAVRHAQNLEGGVAEAAEQIQEGVLQHAQNLEEGLADAAEQGLEGAVQYARNLQQGDPETVADTACCALTASGVWFGCAALHAARWTHWMRAATWSCCGGYEGQCMADRSCGNFVQTYLKAFIHNLYNPFLWLWGPWHCCCLTEYGCITGDIYHWHVCPCGCTDKKFSGDAAHSS